MEPARQNENLVFSRFQNDVLVIMAACLKIDKYQIDLNRNLSEFNLESMVIINIVKAIAEVFNLELSPASLYGHKTIASFNRFLIEMHGAEIAAAYADPSHTQKYAARVKAMRGKKNSHAKRDKTLPGQPACCLSKTEKAEQANHSHLILLSARNNDILNRRVKKWLQLLKDRSERECPIGDLAKALSLGRDFFNARLALVVDNIEDLNERLRSFLSEQPDQEHLFVNTIQREKNQINLFLSDPAARTAVSKWALMGRKDKIAQLWVAGVPIDWRALYPHKDHNTSSRKRRFMDQFLYTDVFTEQIPALLNHITFDPVEGIDQPLLSKAFDALEELGSQATLYLFQQFDIFMDAQTQHPLSQIRTQMGISFHFERLFRGLIHILTKDGIIKNDHDGLRRGDGWTQKSRLNMKDLEIRKDAFVEQFPFFAPHIDLLWICLSQAVDVISENKTAVEVMFPNMSMHLVEPVYKNNPLADYFNEVTCKVLTSYVRKRLSETNPTKAITILELGAGTGGTSSALFEVLQPYSGHIHYIYTDVSSGFVQYGKNQYEGRLPKITFKLLDIEEDIEKQGFKQDDVDIIVAANVVHATRNIKINLMNIKKLLKKNGWLVLNEVIKFQTYSTLTFGLLDGWWLYEDEDNRIPHSPLLSFEQWKKMLKSAGFPAVLSLNQQYHQDAIVFQDIIVAESDGLII